MSAKMKIRRYYITGLLLSIGCVWLLITNHAITVNVLTPGVNPSVKRPSPEEVTPPALPGRRPTSLLEPNENPMVPNTVHYIWFGEYEPLEFHHLLSIKSSAKFIKPDKILFHCDNEPTGQWWKMVKKSVKTLEVRKRQPPSTIFGNEIVLAEHKADVARIQVLMEHGGIYLDTDVIALKSFDPLRVYNYTMGLEYHGNPGRLNNGVIVSTKDAEFLQIWYETYSNFSKREWDYHDSIIPYMLQYEHPHLIHVEEGTINYPTGKQLNLIYKERYDWSRNYAMHLWHRLHQFDHGPANIQHMNTTFGEIARLVLYGTKAFVNPWKSTKQGQ